MKTTVAKLISLGIGVMIFGLAGCQQPQDTSSKEELQVKEQTTAPQKPVKAVARRDDAGHLKADKLNLDFGEIPPGEKVTGQFILTNVGQETVHFKIGKSCGCTVPQISTDRLEPGQSTPLDITFTAPTIAGRTGKSVWADVEPPGKPDKLTMMVTANIKEIIQFEPKQLSFKLHDSAPPDILLVLESTDGVPFKVTGFSIPYQALTVVYDKELSALRQEVTVKADPVQLRNSTARTLIMNIDHPKLRQVSIPFMVTKPFSVYPSSRAFLNLKPGEAADADITVISNFDEEFQLGQIQSEQGFVEVVNTAKQDNGYRIMVKMVAPKDYDKTYLNDFLTIAIKDHSEDTLKVRCYGRIRHETAGK